MTDLPAAAITAAAHAINAGLPSGLTLDEGPARRAAERALEAAAPHITAAERSRLAQPLDKTAGILRSQVAAALETAWEGDGQDPAEAVMAVVRPVLETVAAAERERIRQLAEQHHARYEQACGNPDCDEHTRPAPFADLLEDTP